jgi:hypothetical protein
MAMRWTLAILAAMLASGCSPTVKQVALAPSDVPKASAMLEQGTSTIKGSALLRQRGGGVVTCAGNDVFLIPATESTSQELRRIFGSEQGYVPRGGTETFGGGTLVAAPEPNRRTLCNAQGFFTFNNVRAGKWHIMTSVIWTVGEDHQGGTLLGTTEVAVDREIEVVLSY